MPTDVLDLYAKVKFDSSEFDSGMKDTEEKFSGFGDKVKNGLGTLAKAAAGAVAAGAAAVGKIVSDSVAAYGSYEQLVGGVQTLFGESANKVLENSEKAFQTAGMSMNEYMETSIQSAAALINSLDGDTAKAADLMDMSIIDMSDNVNKMGTTMEAVQNAYRGFSRGNFTMLDNLALGFSGTKQGMEELLEKAEQISGVKYDIESYSDIVQAIHVVQQEMGITGTTAAEAADTIQGSAGSMKAAWENLKVELVKEDGDVGKSIDILVDSALQAFDNIEPKIEHALGGVASFIGKAAPIIVEKLPPIIEQVVPPLLEASSSLVISLSRSVAGALPDLFTSLIPIAKNVLSELTELLLQGAGNLPDLFSKMMPTIEDLVSDLAEFLGRGTGVILTKAPTILSNIASTLAPTILKLAGDVVSSFGTGIVDSIIDSLYESATSTANKAKFDAIYEESLKSAKDLYDEVNGTIEKMNELSDAAKNQIEVDFSEIYKTESLWKELQSLVDENGKVKEGYEERVKYITGELASATGTEIELVDGVIQKYGELSDAIDKAIQKRKAESFLNATQSMYDEALIANSKAAEENRKAEEEIESSKQLIAYYEKKAKDSLNAQHKSYAHLGAFSSTNKNDWAMAGISESEWAEISAAEDRIALARSSRIANDSEVERNNYIIEKTEQAWQAYEEEQYGLARYYASKATETDLAELNVQTENRDKALNNYGQMLDIALTDYEYKTEHHIRNAKEDFDMAVDDANTYLVEECGLSAEDAKNTIISKLSQIDHFDTTLLESFVDGTSIRLADILTGHLRDALGNFILSSEEYAASVNIPKNINSAEDARLRGLGLYANGGFISSGGRGIVAEAGPELLEVQNGGVKITPLTSNAKNTSVSGHSVVVNMNFPHDIKISNDLDMRRVITEATELISENLRNLNIFETRAIGGTGI